MGVRQRTRALRGARAGQGRYGLSGFGEGDGEAECLDLPDVAAELAVDIGAGLVAGPEVGEPGGGIGEQVPDDDQDGAGDRDLGLGLAAAAGGSSAASRVA